MPTPEEDKNDIIITSLAVYSGVTTFIITALAISIYRSKRRCQCKVIRHDPSEELIKSHRTSKPNSYEVDFPNNSHFMEIVDGDSTSLPKAQIHRSCSVPLRPTKNIRLSQCNPFTCTIETRQLPGIPSSSRWSEHTYEEMEVPTGHPYNGIISNVVDSLSQIYSNKGTEIDIQQKFLKQLLKTMKLKNMPLYESLQKCALLEKHQYEEIDEKASTSKPKQYKECQSDSESTYATYVPSARDKKRYQLLKSANNNKLNMTFGSSDHLKYFIESKPSKKSTERDSSFYLQPKNFIPTGGCPPHLKKLCQDSAYNTLEKEKKISLPLEKHSTAKRSYSDCSRPEVPPKPNKMRSKSECEDDNCL